MAHTVCLHGHAIEHVGALHRAPLVRDHDELGALAQLVYGKQELAKICVVERRLDLVEDVERHRTCAVYRKKQRKRGKALLAATHEHHLLDLLATRLCYDLNARLGQMVGVRHLQMCRAAWEQQREHLGKVRINLIEYHEELPAHLALDGSGDLCQRLAGALQVRHLLGYVVRTGLELGVFVHRDLVYGAYGGQLLGEPRALGLVCLAVLGRRHAKHFRKVFAHGLDGTYRTLNLNFNLTLLDLEFTGGCLSLFQLGACCRYGTTCVADGLLEGLGVGLRYGGTVVEPHLPGPRPLPNDVVRLLQRLDAANLFLEVAHVVRGSLCRIRQTPHAPPEVVLAHDEVVLALLHRREL